MRLPGAFVGALEITLNRFLASDALALDKCRQLAGRSLALHMRDLDLTLYLLPHRNNIEVADDVAGRPDVTLSGSLRGLARTLFAAGGYSLTSGDLRIEGDVGLAQRFADLLQGVDFDPEEWLAQQLGDVPAHLLGRAAHGLAGFARRAADHLSLDMAEYLREETRDVIGQAEADELAAGAQQLQARGKRLAARVQKVQRQLER